MNCLTLIGGVVIGAAGLWLYKKHHGPGVLTPERAAIHGELMTRELHPEKLDKMASVFGAEGLPSQAEQLSAKADAVRAIAKEVPGLVERSRAVDQNALGMIAAVREQADHGNPRAQVTCVLIAKYCEIHPMPELGPLGETPIVEGDPGVAFAAAQRAGFIGSPFGGCVPAGYG